MSESFVKGIDVRDANRHADERRNARLRRKSGVVTNKKLKVDYDEDPATDKRQNEYMNYGLYDRVVDSISQALIDHGFEIKDGDDPIKILNGLQQSGDPDVKATWANVMKKARKYAWDFAGLKRDDFKNALNYAKTKHNPNDINTISYEQGVYPAYFHALRETLVDLGAITPGSEEYTDDEKLLDFIDSETEKYKPDPKDKDEKDYRELVFKRANELYPGFKEIYNEVEYGDTYKTQADKRAEAEARAAPIRERDKRDVDQFVSSMTNYIEEPKKIHDAVSTRDNEISLSTPWGPKNLQNINVLVNHLKGNAGTLDEQDRAKVEDWIASGLVGSKDIKEFYTPKGVNRFAGATPEEPFKPDWVALADTTNPNHSYAVNRFNDVIGRRADLARHTMNNTMSEDDQTRLNVGERGLKYHKAQAEKAKQMLQNPPTESLRMKMDEFRPDLLNGADPTKKSMSFKDMLTDRIAKADAGKGAPSFSEAELTSNPWRHVQMQVNDQIDMTPQKGVENGEGVSVHNVSGVGPVKKSVSDAELFMMAKSGEEYQRIMKTGSIATGDYEPDFDESDFEEWGISVDDTDPWDDYHSALKRWAENHPEFKEGYSKWFKESNFGPFDITNPLRGTPIHYWQVNHPGVSQNKHEPGTYTSGNEMVRWDPYGPEAATLRLLSRIMPENDPLGRKERYQAHLNKYLDPVYRRQLQIYQGLR